MQELSSKRLRVLKSNLGFFNTKKIKDFSNNHLKENILLFRGIIINYLGNSVIWESGFFEGSRKLKHHYIYFHILDSKTDYTWNVSFGY